MYSAHVQTDTGETLSIAGLDGHVVGRPILSFMMSVLSDCNRRSEDRARQAPSGLDGLSARARNTLCIVCADLMRATVNSSWDYCEGEDYQSYLDRTGDHDLGEDAFQAGAAHVQGAWTDIDTLIARVQTVIIQLEMALPAGNPELLAGAVTGDFRALHDTLESARSRGAKRARIDIY